MFSSLFLPGWIPLAVRSGRHIRGPAAAIDTTRSRPHFHLRQRQTSSKSFWLGGVPFHGQSDPENGWTLQLHSWGSTWNWTKCALCSYRGRFFLNKAWVGNKKSASWKKKRPNAKRDGIALRNKRERANKRKTRDFLSPPIIVGGAYRVQGFVSIWWFWPQRQNGSKRKTLTDFRDIGNGETSQSLVQADLVEVNDALQYFFQVAHLKMEVEKEGDLVKEASGVDFLNPANLLKLELGSAKFLFFFSERGGDRYFLLFSHHTFIVFFISNFLMKIFTGLHKVVNQTISCPLIT